MQSLIYRARHALKPAAIHFAISAVIALIGLALVLGVWFPPPYHQITGGMELFWLIVSVDVVCGPLLTLVIFSPNKPKTELMTDFGAIGFIQLMALMYGMYTVWEVRPLFTVFEKDRLLVVNKIDLRGARTYTLISEIRPSMFKGPINVGLRPFDNADERNKVLFESLQGGPDYGERPNFYIPMDEEVTKEMASKAKPLSAFLLRHSGQVERAKEIAAKNQADIDGMKYLPIKSRNDWIAVLSKNGALVGFLVGDGF
jgi:hypothetical protein